MRQFQTLNRRVVACVKCPRLVRWREAVGREKRAAFADQEYWAKPLPGFGDIRARLVIVGLAPAAHGGNRTGRIFTGDRSGDWLYRALHQTGFANQPVSVSRDDGLKLRDAYVTAVVRCAPPENRPACLERDTCLPYLAEEFGLLKKMQGIVALGSFAWDGVLAALRAGGLSLRPKPRFGHGREARIGPFFLVGSYHPSQQNTFTGKLTEAMLRDVFQRARLKFRS